MPLTRDHLLKTSDYSKKEKKTLSVANVKELTHSISAAWNTTLRKINENKNYKRETQLLGRKTGNLGTLYKFSKRKKIQKNT